MSSFIANAMWDEAVLERSVFGTDDPTAIWQQALQVCPDAVDCFAFSVSVGGVLGLVLADGRRVALKFHVGPREPHYLRSVQRVQAHLRENGFPCPRPLGVVGHATLEEWTEEGRYRDGREPGVRRVIAEHLERLHRLTQELHPLPGMRAGSRPQTEPLWPRPHNVLFDFEATSAGAEWIDEIAGRAKAVRTPEPGRLVIGHADWTVKHFRFDGLRPTVIYDWDSLTCEPEAVLVGGAAANFTYGEREAGPRWPSAEEAAAFIEDYERARTERFTAGERLLLGAATVYSRAYTTRCVHAVGGDARALALEAFAEAFLAAPPG